MRNIQPIGTLFISPGRNFIYQVVSHPVCRLYEVNYKGQSHFVQSLDEKNNNEDYLSYEVCCIEGQMTFIMTDNGVNKLYGEVNNV